MRKIRKLTVLLVAMLMVVTSAVAVLSGCGDKKPSGDNGDSQIVDNNGGDENKNPGGDENKNPGGDENKNPGGQATEYVYITFDSNGGSAVNSQKIRKNREALKPTNPTKPGYSFKWWNYEGEEFLFDTSVEQDITLVAYWGPIKLRLGTKVEAPTEWNYAELEVVDEDGEDVTADVTIADGKIAFPGIGSFTFKSNGTECGSYVVEEYETKMTDFDRPDTLTFGEMEIDEVTHEMFKWENNDYQPTLRMKEESVEAMKGAMVAGGNNRLRVHLRFEAGQDCVTVDVGMGKSYVGNDHGWQTRVYDVEDVEKFELWFATEAYPRAAYFYLEFFNEVVEPVEEFAVKKTDFDKTVSYANYEVQDVSRAMFCWSDGSYQPKMTMTAAGIEKLKAAATADDCNKVVLHIINVCSAATENLFVIVNGIFVPINSGWKQYEYFVDDLEEFEITLLPNSSSKSVYFYFEFDNEVVEPVEEFVVKTTDFDKTVSYANYEVSDVSRAMFSWTSSEYHTTLNMTAAGIEKLKAAATADDCNKVVLHIINVCSTETVDNPFVVVNGSYTSLNSGWQEFGYLVEDLAEFKIQLLAESSSKYVYFYFEFDNEIVEEDFTITEDDFSVPCGLLVYEEMEVGDVTCEMFHWADASGTYQPKMTLKADGIAKIKAAATEGHYNVVKLHVKTDCDNGNNPYVVINGRYFGIASGWQVMDFDIATFEKLEFFVQVESSRRNVYFYFEFDTDFTITVNDFSVPGGNFVYRTLDNPSDRDEDGRAEMFVWDDGTGAYQPTLSMTATGLQKLKDGLTAGGYSKLRIHIATWCTVDENPYVLLNGNKWVTTANDLWKWERHDYTAQELNELTAFTIQFLMNTNTRWVYFYFEYIE